MKNMIFFCCLLLSAPLFSQDFEELLEQEKNLVKTIQFSTPINSFVYNVNGNFVHNKTTPRFYQMLGDIRSLRFIYIERQLLNNRFYIENFDGSFTAPYKNRLKPQMYPNGILGLAGIPGGRFNIFKIDMDSNGQVKEFAANLEQNFEGHNQHYGAEVRFNSTLPIVSNPAMFMDQHLVIPLIELSLNDERVFTAAIIHPTEPGSFQYQVDALIPVEPKNEEQINLALAFNRKVKKFVIPSVIKKESNGQYSEYRMKFNEFPSNIKPGDFLSLQSISKIR